MQTDYIQSDETTIPVMNNERHKTVKGYIWLVRSVMTGRQFFYYDKGSRSGKVVLKLFGKFRGAIQTDGYERYEMLDARKVLSFLAVGPMHADIFGRQERMTCSVPTMRSHRYSCFMTWSVRLTMNA